MRIIAHKSDQNSFLINFFSLSVAGFLATHPRAEQMRLWWVEIVFEHEKKKKTWKGFPELFATSQHLIDDFYWKAAQKLRVIRAQHLAHLEGFPILFFLVFHIGEEKEWEYYRISSFHYPMMCLMVELSALRVVRSLHMLKCSIASGRSKEIIMPIVEEKCSQIIRFNHPRKVNWINSCAFHCSHYSSCNLSIQWTTPKQHQSMHPRGKSTSSCCAYNL